jgi:hypothetical protein
MTNAQRKQALDDIRRIAEKAWDGMTDGRADGNLAARGGIAQILGVLDWIDRAKGKDGAA